MWRYFAVQIFFDVQTLSNGFYHQIALAKQGQIVVIIGGLYVVNRCFAGQWCWFLLFQRSQCFFHDGVFRAFFGWQIK